MFFWQVNKKPQTKIWVLILQFFLWFVSFVTIIIALYSRLKIGDFEITRHLRTRMIIICSINIKPRLTLKHYFLFPNTLEFDFKRQKLQVTFFWPHLIVTYFIFEWSHTQCAKDCGPHKRTCTFMRILVFCTSSSISPSCFFNVCALIFFLNFYM